MDLYTMLRKLNADLKNEWKHHNFYLRNASLITGPHMLEYKEFLLEEAASEMKHIVEFSDLIVGLGGDPDQGTDTVFTSSDIETVIKYALRMEDEVVANYVARIHDCEAMSDRVNAYWITVFLEKQIENSRTDADKLRQIARGFAKPTDVLGK